jgi:hypothetical protein
MLPNQALPAKIQRDFVPQKMLRDTEERANSAQQADGMSPPTLQSKLRRAGLVR